MASGRRCWRSSASPRLYRYCAFAASRLTASRNARSDPARSPLRRESSRASSSTKRDPVELDGFFEERSARVESPWSRSASPGARESERPSAGARALSHRRRWRPAGGPAGARPPPRVRRAQGVWARLPGRAEEQRARRRGRRPRSARRRAPGGRRPGRQPFDGACEMSRGLAMALEPDERAAEIVVTSKLSMPRRPGPRAGPRSRRTGAPATP